MILRHRVLSLCAALSGMLGFASLAQAASANDAAASVVNITTTANGDKDVGTGFVWSKPTWVVTALHVVAGKEKIEVYSGQVKNQTQAKVVAVNREADLALLALTEDMGLKPLKIAKVDPNSRQEFSIWGYPRNVATVAGDPVRFTRSAGDEHPTLKNIFRSSEHLKKEIGEQGFPSLNAKIIRISDTIQPGHSGAPIVDGNNNVVAIGDGGLREGIARINWAIPASIYVEGLPTSKDTLPSASVAAKNLFSASVDETDAPEAPTGIEGLIRLGVMTLAEAFATLDNDMAAMTEKYGDLLQTMHIVVYEDKATGATFAVPEGMKVEFEGDRNSGRFIHASGDDKSVLLQIYFGHGSDMAEAKTLLAAYRDAIGETAHWQPVADAKDEIDHDDEEQYYSEYTVRQAEQDGQQLFKYTKLAVDQGDFIGASMFFTEAESDSGAKNDTLKALELCIELAQMRID